MIDPKQGPLYQPRSHPVARKTPLSLGVRMDMDNVLLCFAARDGSYIELSMEDLAWEHAGPTRRVLLSWCDDRRSDCRKQP